MTRNHIFRISALCLALALASIGFPQSRKAPPRPKTATNRAPFLQQVKAFEDTPYVSRAVYLNGMTVLVEEFKSQPLISIQLSVRAGSADEASQNPGVASLLAAMVFRHAPDKSTGSVAQNIYALGGTANTSVNFDATRFEINSPSAQWKKALNLLLPAAMNPSLEPGDLAIEATSLIRDARETLDDPREFSRENLLELAYAPARTGLPAEIARGAVQTIKREDVVSFHKAMYLPSRMTLVISGDVVSSEVFNEVAGLIGKFTDAAKSNPAPVRIPQNQFRYRLIRGDAPFPNIVFGFHLPPDGSADFRALEVMSAALGLGQGAILNYRLRDQKGLIWAQETELLSNRASGYLLMRMEVDPSNIDRSQIAALTEFELLKREELSETDMARAVAQLELAYWKRFDTVSGRAGAFSRFETVGDWKGLNRYLAELKKVSPADVMRVAGKYLTLDHCSLVEYLPEGGDPRNPTTEGIRQTFEGLLRLAADEEQAKRAKELVPYLEAPAKTDQFKSSEIQYPFQPASILRGPEIIIREDHMAPIVEMGIYFPGGKFAEKKENAGITRLMLEVIFGGVKDSQGGRFYHQLEVYGGRVSPVVADDYFGLDFSILSPNFEAGFDLLQQTLKAQVFDKNEIARQKKLLEVDSLRRSKSGNRPWDMLNQLLFQGFPYSSNGLGTPASLAGISPSDIAKWHNDYVKNHKPYVVAIGDTKGTGVAAPFVKDFSGSRMLDSKLPEEWAKAVEKGVAVEQAWDRNQSLILIGFQAPPVDDEDEPAATALEGLLGSQGRISQELREKMGAAQRVFALYQPRLRGGSFILGASTNPDSEDAVYKALCDGIRRISAEPVSYRDFRSAVNSAAGNYGLRVQQRFVQIVRIFQYMLTGKGISGFESFAMNVQKVREEDLSEIAGRILALDKAVTVRMHGQKKQQP